MKLFFYFYLFLVTIAFVACQLGATESKKYTRGREPVAEVSYRLVTDSLKSPVQLVAPADNSKRLFVCELNGRISILKNGHLLPKPFIDLHTKLEQKDTAPDVRAVYTMAFHPDFARNKRFYVCYNAPAKKRSDKCKIMVAEYTASATNPDVADLSSERPVFEMENKYAGGDNCEIAFGPDGYLYIAIGALKSDFDKTQAQNLSSFLGKVLRIDVNKSPYAIPADNPFIHTKNAKGEIWAYGLRRFWRFSFDPQTHQLLGGDVGDKKQEEVDAIQKGGNYGWPVWEGDSLLLKNKSTDMATFVAPLNTYTHKDGICIIGGVVYQGNDLPFLKDKYVFADLNGRLFSLTKNNAEKWTRDTIHITNLPADPLLIYSLDNDQQNELYVCGALNTPSGYKGAVYKLVHR